jgi:hypothetical protein
MLASVFMTPIMDSSVTAYRDSQEQRARFVLKHVRTTHVWDSTARARTSQAVDLFVTVVFGQPVDCVRLTIPRLVGQQDAHLLVACAAGSQKLDISVIACLVGVVSVVTVLLTTATTTTGTTFVEMEALVSISDLLSDVLVTLAGQV